MEVYNMKKEFLENHLDSTQEYLHVGKSENVLILDRLCLVNLHSRST